MAAYDVKVLGQKLVKRLLVAAKGGVQDASQWVQDSVKESPTPYDDLLLAVVPSVEAWGTAQLDKLIGAP